MKRLWPFGWSRDDNKDDAAKKSRIERKPLSTKNDRVWTYTNWKQILAMLEPNVRRNISHTIPSLRSTEKHTPLSLDLLSFGAMGMVMNDTSYQLGIIRKFHPGYEMTQQIREENESGGTRHDLDRFGLEDRPDQIRQGLHVEFLYCELPTRAENMAMVEQLEGYLANLWPAEEDDDAEILEELENEYKNHIFPLRLQRDNRSGPYESVLRYKKSSKGSGEAMVFEKNYQPGSKAMFTEYKKLVHDFLGDRTQIVEVKKLEFSAWNTAIPLPPNVRFKIKELSVMGDAGAALKEMLPFIDESSFPLETLETWHYHRYPDEDMHPVIQSAKLLVLKGHYEASYQFDVYPKNVHYVDCEESRPGEMKYLPFIRHWLAHPPDVGTRFTAGFFTQRYYSKKVKAIKKKFKLSGEGPFTIPLTADTQIKMDHKTIDPTDPTSYNQSFMLMLEVVPVQQQQQQGFFSSFSKISEFFSSFFWSK